MGPRVLVYGAMLKRPGGFGLFLLTESDGSSREGVSIYILRDGQVLSSRRQCDLDASRSFLLLNSAMRRELAHLAATKRLVLMFDWC